MARKIQLFWGIGVKLWQHNRVLEIILCKVALVDPIKSCSSELQKVEGGKVVVCDLVNGSEAKGYGILNSNGQKRILKDMRSEVRVGNEAQAEAAGGKRTES